VDPVPDPLVIRKSGSVGNRTRDLSIGRQELHHRGGLKSLPLSAIRMITQSEVGLVLTS
jgi:hypothetical protein